MHMLWNRIFVLVKTYLQPQKSPNLSVELSNVTQVSVLLSWFQNISKCNHTYDRLVEGEIFFVAKAETADQMILHLSVILQELFKVSKPIPMSLRLVVLRLKPLSPKALLSGIVYWL